MYPTLFRIGPIPIQSYGMMMMIGFLVAMYLASRRARKSGADQEMVMNLGMLSLISGVIGARIFYVIHHWHQFASSDNPFFSAINLTTGGLEFYGGFLTAVAAVIVYLWLKKKSMRWYLDILAPSIMIGLAFGRIGCLLNGCCWGGATQLPMAVQFPYGSLPFEHQWAAGKIEVPGELVLVFPNGTPSLIDREVLQWTDRQLQSRTAMVAPDSQLGQRLGLLNAHLQTHQTDMEGLRQIIRDRDLRSLPVHPTQLYSSLNAFFIAGVLSLYYWRRKRDGMVIAWLFVIYPISRFILEAIRTDNPLDTFGFTVSQGISLAAIPVAIMYMVILRYLPAQSPLAVAEIERAKSAAVARPVKSSAIGS